MAFIHFDKEKLTNSGFSFSREWLLANTVGAYSSSTLAICNTRKYHGLLITEQSQIDDERYVLLSSLDETIHADDKIYRLGTHQYPNTCTCEGFNYLEEFSMRKIPTWTIKINDIVLKKEILLVKGGERLLIRYTLKESEQPLQMKFNPLLAFRNINALTHSNNNAERIPDEIPGGMKVKMYPGFSDLCMQFSKKSEFIADPYWNNFVEYRCELDRGYDFNEDLYCPGYFQLTMKKGDQLIFSAGLTETNAAQLEKLFEAELKENIPLDDFTACLERAAEQFIVHGKKGTEVIAGFHWFGRWGRDTFISLPGLTLSTGNPKIFKAVTDTMIGDLKGGLFPNLGKGDLASYNSADSPLWFFWALQQYAAYTGNISLIWKEYGDKMKDILGNYRAGTLHRIHMQEDGLLFAGEPGVALTWMDAVINGYVVTPRTGLAVELNALWYNAIQFALEAASLAGDNKFIEGWKTLPAQIEQSFEKTFWSREKGYLADCVNNNEQDWSLRPNQIFAVSLPYSPIIDKHIKASVVEAVKSKLLTPRGLRTLSPDDVNYKSHYTGNQENRDHAYHQGTVWPWLLGHFAEAYFKVYGEGAISFIHSLYENFAPAALEYGIGTIAEIYDADAPHQARGTISQAWSVAELLRIRNLVTLWSKKKLTGTSEVGQLN